MGDRLSRTVFRESMAHFASGVTVITAVSDDVPSGLTASAFTSVSLDPPLVLVCIGVRASAHDPIVSAAAFGVNVLDEDQRWIAEQFARQGIDRFQGVSLRALSPAPVIDGSLVQLVCTPHARYGAGDHTVLVGEVVDAVVAPGRPLVHFARRFGAFEPAVPREAALVASSASSISSVQPGGEEA